MRDRLFRQRTVNAVDATRHDACVELGLSVRRKIDMLVRRRPPFFGGILCAGHSPPQNPHHSAGQSAVVYQVTNLFQLSDLFLGQQTALWFHCMTTEDGAGRTWRRRRQERLSQCRYQYGFGTSTRRHLLATFSSTSKRCVVMHLPLILTYSLSTDPISGCKFQIFHLHSGISQRTLRFRTQGGLPCSRTRVESISTLISWSPNHSCQCTICSRPLTWLAIQCLRSTVFRNLPKSARRVARYRPTLLPHGRTRRSFGGLGISSGRRCHACAAAA